MKLDTDVLRSSLWAEDPPTRIVFLTLLAMCGPDGIVEARAPGIAIQSNLTLEEVREALARLEAPDPDSRTKEHEGRRIQEVADGYLVLNYTKYREKDHTAAARAKRYRQGLKKRLQPETAPPGPGEQIPAAAPPNALVAGRRGALELEWYALVRELAALSGEDPTVIGPRSLSYRDPRGNVRRGVRVESVSDDRLLHALADLKADVAERKRKK